MKIEKNKETIETDFAKTTSERRTHKEVNKANQMVK